MKHPILKLAGWTWAIVLAAAVAVQAAPPVQEKPKLEPYQCGKVQRLHVFGSIFLASQPTQEDFKTAAENGIKTVLNLRTPQELDWDEAALVKKLGMNYVNIPITPRTFTDEKIDQARKLLNDSKNRPLLVHCASANRVGAIWLAHRVLDHGLSYQEARKEARTVGLRSPVLEKIVQRYIAKHQRSQ